MDALSTETGFMTKFGLFNYAMRTTVFPYFFEFFCKKRFFLKKTYTLYVLAEIKKNSKKNRKFL
jgi:hypothetical protein